MTLDETLLLMLLYGPFVFSGLLALVLLTPAARSLPGRFSLAASAAPPAITFGIIVLGDLVMGRQELWPLTPVAVAVVLVITVIARTHSVRGGWKRVAIMTLVLVANAWGGWMAWMWMHPCFMGACA